MNGPVKCAACGGEAVEHWRVQAKFPHPWIPTTKAVALRPPSIPGWVCAGASPADEVRPVLVSSCRSAMPPVVDAPAPPSPLDAAATDALRDADRLGLANGDAARPRWPAPPPPTLPRPEALVAVSMADRYRAIRSVWRAESAARDVALRVLRADLRAKQRALESLLEDVP